MRHARQFDRRSETLTRANDENTVSTQKWNGLVYLHLLDGHLIKRALVVYLGMVATFNFPGERFR